MWNHPIWLVGFRPFFTLAFVAGVVFPVLWALAFAGWLILPSQGMPVLTWHAHEMFYGFGWAVMAGFLLTASKNWVKIRGLHGGGLALAVLLWVVERGAVFLPPSILRTVLLNAFPVYVIGYVVGSLVRYRKQDSFPDNGFFILALPLVLVAKNFLLEPSMRVVGITMTLGIFRVAFAVMFERTMTQFMKNAMGVSVPRWRWLDLAIKALVLVAIFEALLPAPVAATVLALAAALLFGRWLTWKPLTGLRRFEIGVMYVGYFGLVLHLGLQALGYVGIHPGVGTLALHTFTFLCMGLIIPPMFIRIGQGHTGRALLFARSDRWAIGTMGAAAFFRLAAPTLWPSHYTLWVGLASIGWSLCFAIIGARIIPFLWAPRVDGRVH